MGLLGHLGLWLQRVTGRRLLIWLAECHVHEREALEHLVLQRLRLVLGLGQHLVHRRGDVHLRRVHVARDLRQALQLPVHRQL